jgi:phytoene desaturase
MLTYLTQKGAFRTYGYPPEGTVGPMRRLAEVVERHGGTVWLSAEVDHLELEDGRVTEATVLRGGRQLRVRCDAVVSNAGPTATIALAGEDHLPAKYVALVRERVHPAPMFAVTFASPRPLSPPAGIVFFADTERVAALAHLTSTVHEVAPPGWHLYVAYAVPAPAMSAFDEEAERAVVMAELDRELPGFADARILAAPLLRGDWPAQRVVAGSEIDSATPIPNLWNVGDATRAYGDGGVQGCMTNGRHVARCVLAAVRPRATVPAHA